ncbi:maleylacetate reductase [Pseudarthrobacter sp. NIBRBAC000502772]|uniref:maleylacetate reductase n=1 Tax=Pseudarthrobacter sp. NIBRBAC000502772 TaxID=2590775 RepID=UPI001131C3A5|nr:maleylacetate reductase [Pseudarthrobacter sp. NIBRBAC000502772]QDG65209.1 maleylacetate reductase [Pseudarthrobacter sp. NIBRBAC000502772]
MSTPFFYEALPMRVSFGAGYRSKLADEVNKLGLKRVLVLATEFQADLAREISDSLGELSVGVYAKAEMHVPIETARDAQRIATEAGADGCVAVGGGSTTGLGKAIALEYGTPIIALPTTYAGSEMTPIWGLTADSVKKTGRDPRVLPTSVIYDPELTLSLPVGMSVTSGFNAIAHAVEALYAPDGSPVISLMAEEGIRALITALPNIVEDPQNIKHRSDALYGAWLCGATLGATTMSLHHKLCHTLGGTFNLPHAETHTVVLPYALAYNAPSAPGAIEALRRATGAEDPATHLRELSLKLGAPASLRELGLTEESVETAVDLATRNPYANPREINPEGIRRLLTAALNGDPVTA